MRYLLDTNACITLLRRRDDEPRRRVTRRLSAVAQRDVVLCSVVRQELLAGVYHSKRRVEANREVRELLDTYGSLAFGDEAAEVAARVQHDLYRLGTPIGAYDVQIAAIGLAHDLTVATHNLGHFGRLPDLRIEDWEA